MGTEVNHEYGADQIQILEGLEAGKKFWLPMMRMYGQRSLKRY